MKKIIIALIFLNISCGSGMIGLIEKEQTDKEIHSTNYIGIWDTQNKFLGDIKYFDLDSSPLSIYDYYSSSSHTDLITLNKYKSNIFFTKYNSSYYIYVIHNLESINSGNSRSDWVISITNNNKQDSIILSDDNFEVIRTESSYDTIYDCFWDFQKETDGCVIGPLDNTFIITLFFLNVYNIEDIYVHSNDETYVNLLSSELPINVTLHF